MNNKVIVFAVSALGLLIALFLGMAVGEGRRMHIAAVFALMIGAPILLSLGKNYWYLIPASLLSGLPAIPFGGRNINLAELCIALCFGIFITRVAFKLDKIVLWRATHIPIYLFMAWVLFIFCLHPVGLAAFGSATIGGRFYMKLLLAFMAFIVIASRDITEKDCKWVIGFVVIGTSIQAAYNIFSFFYGASDDVFAMTSDLDGFYTWHQSLSLPAVAISFMIFAWKKPSSILQLKNLPLTFTYIFCIGLALYSGKRIGIAAVFIAPIVGAIIHRQHGYIWLAGTMGILLSIVIVFGHGEVFRLPLQVQRALSILPAKWDNEIQAYEGGADPFRESLRRFAWENINRHPIVGKGFAINYSEIIAQIAASRYQPGGDMNIAGHAIGRSWHNTWLGYAADFGIPLAMIQGILFLTVVIVSYKTIRKLEIGSPKFILIAYLFILTIRDLIASHTSGHTALDAFDRWWLYAMLFAIYASVNEKRQSPMNSTNLIDAFMQRVTVTKHESRMN